MVSKQSTDWIYVRDGAEQLCCQRCNQWDRITMLAALSSDPRSIDELATAWSRYRPDSPLMDREWSAMLPPPDSADWLWVDLENQHFACREAEPTSLDAGSFQRDDGPWMPGNPVVWLNIPPWWRAEPGDAWPVAAPSDELSPKPTLDFRSVLFGLSLVEDIVDRVLSTSRKRMPRRFKSKAAARAAVRAAVALPLTHGEGASDVMASDRDCLKHWADAIKLIHLQWLTLPRKDLNGRTPRFFLHEGREWKDRELEYRREQWSQERRAPPAISRASHLFRFGPMGTEEVICYFDLCRELISAACRWAEDDPRIAWPLLVEQLDQLKGGLLESEIADGEGATAQEIIDKERSLLPRLASSDPIDCDCPLCRLNHQEPELFGPTFSTWGGLRLELENEFAFSLFERRKDWQEARNGYSPWNDAPLEASDSRHASTRVASVDTTNQSSDDAWAEGWQSSFVGKTLRNPRLSLFSIGARLAEIVTDLKGLGADRAEIDRVNEGFDDLTRAVRDWLVTEASGTQWPNEKGSAAAGNMIKALQSLSLKYPRLTTKTADVQALVEQWQSELTAER